MKKKNKMNKQKSLQENKVSPKKSFKFQLSFKQALLFITLIVAFFYGDILIGKNWFWDDVLNQEYPNRIFMHNAFHNFEFPHWNPYSYGGIPFFASMQPGVLYLPNFLTSLLPVPHHFFWPIIHYVIIIHLIIAGIGMLKLLEGLNYKREISLMGSIVFMLSSFFVLHVHHCMMLNILVWLPWIVHFLLKTESNSSLTDAILAGLFLGLSGLAGHPQITFYEYIFLSCFILYLFLQSSHKSIKLFTLLAIPLLTSVLILLVQYLPAIELSNESVRTNWSYEEISACSISFRQLIQFYIPKFFGSNTHSNYGLNFCLNDVNGSGYWSFWETTFYFTIVIFILGTAQFSQLKKNRFVLFCLIWFFFSLSIALGDQFFLYKILYHTIPGFNKFRNPARILFTWNLLYPILATMTLKDLIQSQKTKQTDLFIKILIGFGFIISFLVLTDLHLLIWPELKHGKYYNYAKLQTFIMFSLLSVFSIVYFLFKKKKINNHLFLILLTLIAVVDIFLFGFRLHKQQEGAIKYHSKHQEIIDFLKKESEKDIFRTNTRDLQEPRIHLMHLTTGMIEEIALLSGINPLNLKRKLPPTSEEKMLDLLNVRFKIKSDRERGVPTGIVYHGNRMGAFKMFYQYKVFDSDSLMEKYMLSKQFDHLNEVLLEKQPSLEILPTSQAVQDSIEVIDYSSNSIKLKVSTEKNGILWLSEIFYPAWKAKVDGKRQEILRADYVFRAIEIPVGEHTVEIYFDSKWFRIGAAISSVTLISSLIILVWFMLKNKKKS